MTTNWLITATDDPRFGPVTVAYYLDGSTVVTTGEPRPGWHRLQRMPRAILTVEAGR